MIMRFCSATLLALAALPEPSSSFLAPHRPTRSSHTAIQMVDSSENGDEGEKGEGSSRFKELLELSKQKGAESRQVSSAGIENPFLTQQSQTPQSTNPQELSVEEQARLFREMMQNSGAQQPQAPSPPPQRVASTDRAGRPVGRNRDADTIANTADLYFAQLKRDSSVRGEARQRGDHDTADQIFTDDGIQQLEELLYTNPYLSGQREKEEKFFDAIPEEALKPFFDPDNVPEEVKSSSGISYKEMLKKKRQKAAGTENASPTTSAVAQAPPVSSETQPVAPVQDAAAATSPPPRPQPVASQQPVAPIQDAATAASSPPQSQPVASQQSATVATTNSGASNPEESRRKIRTLMGMLLKHRGGPGFGKGRLKGREIDQFTGLLDEVVGQLRQETAELASSPDVLSPVSQNLQVAVPPTNPIPPAAPAVPAQTGTANAAQMDSMIACVEGAVTMYKNCPPELQSSVLVTLRAALMSAANTSDKILGGSGASFTQGTPTQIESTLVVIEGAIGMYKNSPAELRDSVLVTLRAALASAVATCDSLLGTQSDAPAAVAPQQPTAVDTPLSEQVVSQPVAPVQAVVTPPQQAAVTAPVVEPSATPPPATPPPASPANPVPPILVDPNSKSLEVVYNTLKDASGEGSLGLRSDLTSAEAAELSDQLGEMRKILLTELDAGLGAEPKAKPDPKHEVSAEEEASAPAEVSTKSKYQQMLAKAKAEKAAKN